MKTTRRATAIAALVTAAVSVCALGGAGFAPTDPADSPLIPGSLQDGRAATEPPGPIDRTWTAASRAFEGSKAETKPSRDVSMSFNQPIEIRRIAVKGGDTVTPGQVLANARDEDIVAALEEQRVLADSDLEVRAAQNQLELAEFRYDQLREGGVASPQELRERELEFKSAQLGLEQARQNDATRRLRVTQLEGRLARYRLEAPFAGIVEEVLAEVGQGMNDSEPVIRIVNIDRLEMDVYAPTDKTIAMGLKSGDPAWALIRIAGEGQLVQGVVEYVSPVGDSVSQERRVRVSVANPQAWPAGTPARVRFDRPDPNRWGIPLAGSEGGGS